jgi:hypothetical protein
MRATYVHCRGRWLGKAGTLDTRGRRVNEAAIDFPGGIVPIECRPSSRGSRHFLLVFFSFVFPFFFLEASNSVDDQLLSFFPSLRLDSKIIQTFSPIHFAPCCLLSSDSCWSYNRQDIFLWMIEEQTWPLIAYNRETQENKAES